jgi:hypothetical protein
MERSGDGAQVSFVVVPAKRACEREPKSIATGVGGDGFREPLPDGQIRRQADWLPVQPLL